MMLPSDFPTVFSPEPAIMLRAFLGAGLIFGIMGAVALGADPTPAEAIQLVEKLKGKHQPKGAADKARAVDLGRKKVTDNDLKILGALTTLQDLNLSGSSTEKGGKTTYAPSSISDDGVKSLAGMTLLRKLQLDGSNITDAGLVHLAGMKNLEEISLSSTKVTDAGMEALTKLPKLKSVLLYDTKVTDSGVGVLKRWKIEIKVLR